MGNGFFKEPPPPMVLVPPLFDVPPLAARVRMLESSYNQLFGKFALKCLFEDYFEEANQLTARIMLKPLDDPNVDLIATVSSPLDAKSKEKIVGDALFRWQRDVDDPNTFADLFVTNSEPILRLRTCAFNPEYGVGAFGIFPLLGKNRISSENLGTMGLRYGSESLSVGATFMPLSHNMPTSAWLVSKMGRLTTGVQYKPDYESKGYTYVNDLKNFSCAVGYGSGSCSPVTPSFNFALELAGSDQLTASFYQHFVVQRRVKNPFEENEIVGITNYIDFGFELNARIDEDESSDGVQESSFQVAASWQANKNFLLKGKLGPFISSLALIFKSWWKPSFTCSLSAVRDRRDGEVALGFGIRFEDLREASYQRADPNYIMLTPTKEHLAEGIQWKTGSRPMLQSDVDTENFDRVPKELRPAERIL